VHLCLADQHDRKATVGLALLLIPMQEDSNGRFRLGLLVSVHDIGTRS
jgi:hypothetical protein